MRSWRMIRCSASHAEDEPIQNWPKSSLGGQVKVVGHNLKYDYVLLRRYSIRIRAPHFDTMLAAHECFGDWDFFNLGAVAKKLMGLDVKRYRDNVDEGQTLQDIPFK